MVRYTFSYKRLLGWLKIEKTSVVNVLNHFFGSGDLKTDVFFENSTLSFYATTCYFLYTVHSMSEKVKVINIRELTDLRDDFVGLLAQLGQPR